MLPHTELGICVRALDDDLLRQDIPQALIIRCEARIGRASYRDRDFPDWSLQPLAPLLLPSPLSV